jgi:hypothetical protein
VSRFRQVTDIAWLVVSMLIGTLLGIYVFVPGDSIWHLTAELQVQPGGTVGEAVEGCATYRKSLVKAHRG